MAVDEALRSFDENALQALINTGLPRDSNAGEGATCKSLKPERGYSEKGETRQLPGMGWYVLCFATNSNARNSTVAESLRTLTLGAMVTYAPGAPQSLGLSSAMTVRCLDINCGVCELTVDVSDARQEEARPNQSCLCFHG